MPVEVLRYVNYADRWGWTPDQVDDLPLRLEPWLLPVAAAKDEAARIIRERNTASKGRRPWRRSS